jgi:hypothetical protein
MAELMISDVGLGANFTPGPLSVESYTGEYEIDESGWVRFLTSGVLRVANDVVIDAFLVGGGGAGGADYRKSSDAVSTSYIAGGGGGGYTQTKRAIKLYAQWVYHIIVGQGGVYTPIVPTSSSDRPSIFINMARGGTTKAFGVNASGGHAGKASYTINNVSSTEGGGAGGSGGGAPASSTGYGGTDGSDGEGGNNPGSGQGRTTRAFEEADGELFSSGGRGGNAYTGGSSSAHSVKAGAPNTGDGGYGDSGYYYTSGSTRRFGSQKGKNGGSGIVIIREAVS